MNHASSIDVVHRPEAACFEAFVDGQRCVVDYLLRDGVASMHHTYVPPSLEGRGIAGQLVAAALAHARAAGWRVRPTCSYVAAYMRRHPETADLLG